MLGTAADASTPRGSASCADPRGVLLSCLKAPCFKELYVIRRERSLQPHVMLPPHTASILLLRPLIVQLAAAACCCWCRELQWRLEEANLEIFILRGSSYFFAGVFMCVFDYQRLTLSVPFEERATAHPSRIRAQEIKGNRDFRASKLAKFSGLQAQSVPAAAQMRFP